MPKAATDAPNPKKIFITAEAAKPSAMNLRPSARSPTTPLANFETPYSTP